MVRKRVKRQMGERRESYLNFQRAFRKTDRDALMRGLRDGAELNVRRLSSRSRTWQAFDFRESCACSESKVGACFVDYGLPSSCTGCKKSKMRLCPDEEKTTVIQRQGLVPIIGSSKLLLLLALLFPTRGRHLVAI